MTALLKYDAACRAIAEAKTIDEVQEWIDKAAAVREYTRRIKNRQLEIDAIEIRIKAKRRRGEILIELKENGQLREGKKKLSEPNDSLPRLSLDDLGVSADESSEDQKIARIDGNSFDRLIARCRAFAEEHPAKHSFDVLRPPPEHGPINGARALMGSREEDPDSLDYFPTPPWATRALIEKVLAHLGITEIASAWEPACGEGHIVEVLCEYCPKVFASDIADYGYGHQHEDWEEIDFLKPPKGHKIADWIITNPPFGDKAAQFVLRALDEARVGVAMFFRLQWIPTNGRYEKIFRDHAPTLVSFFCERVNLCKGRWEPDGSTATDYIWLVWLKGQNPRAPFWIPPGQRQALEHAGDRERFTAHPVIKALPSHDPETGEVIEGEPLDIPQFLRREETQHAQ